MTGMAAKPVNGSWLLAAAASWRTGWVFVAVAGATPPAGALPPPDECFLPPLASAGRTPPSGVGEHSAAGEPLAGDVVPFDVSVHGGHGEADAGRAEQGPGDEHAEDGDA
jgi:hypothetical protein